MSIRNMSIRNVFLVSTALVSGVVFAGAAVAADLYLEGTPVEPNCFASCFRHQW